MYAVQWCQQQCTQYNMSTRCTQYNMSTRIVHGIICQQDCTQYNVSTRCTQYECVNKNRCMQYNMQQDVRSIIYVNKMSTKYMYAA